MHYFRSCDKVYHKLFFLGHTVWFLVHRDHLALLAFFLCILNKWNTGLAFTATKQVWLVFYIYTYIHIRITVTYYMQCNNTFRSINLNRVICGIYWICYFLVGRLSNNCKVLGWYTNTDLYHLHHIFSCNEKNIIIVFSILMFLYIVRKLVLF